MNEQETFIRVDRALQSVVEQIRDDQWSMELPPDFPTSDDKPYTLREILGYQAFDEAWIPDMVAGHTLDEAGADKFGEPFGDELLGDDPKRRFGELVQASIDAVGALDDADLDGRTVHYTYGDFPAREALWHAIVFRAMRVSDVAKAVGTDSDLPEDLVQRVWDIVEPNADTWRAMGVFGPAVDVDGDAPLQDRLLALTGRHP